MRFGDPERALPIVTGFVAFSIAQSINMSGFLESVFSGGGQLQLSRWSTLQASGLDFEKHGSNAELVLARMQAKVECDFPLLKKKS